MLSHILDCPACKHRFTFDKEDRFPDTILCPSCKTANPYYEYNTLVLCSKCRRKLKIKIQYLESDKITCPVCNEYIDAEHFISQDNNMYTYAGDNRLAPAKEQRLLKDGEYIDKFQIVSFIGKGGMAEVYLAEHLLLKQKCAIKVMRTKSTDDQIYIKRFVREAKLAHSIDNPHIIRVFDAGCDFKTGHMFIAMDYVDGKNLIELAQGNPMSEKALIDILYSIATALKVLHENKIVHRDIKPSNIMQTKNGLYKLMDLGIAKSDTGNQAGEMTLTMDRQTIGTPSYASPEQCQSAHTADIRSDIYSLGATLYHLASGKIPYNGATTVEIILKVMKHDLVPLKNLRPDLSRSMLNLIDSMMKSNPDERPQSPDELIAFANARISNKNDFKEKTLEFIKKIPGTAKDILSKFRNSDDKSPGPAHIKKARIIKDNADLSFAGRLLKSVAVITLSVIILAAGIYCCFEYTASKNRRFNHQRMSFTDFLKYSVFKQTVQKKTNTANPIDINERFENKFSRNYTELMTYPDPENRYSAPGEVQFSEDKNNQPAVRWDFSKPETISDVPLLLIYQGQKNRWIRETSKVWLEHCWNGALHIDSDSRLSSEKFSTPSFSSLQDYSLSITFSTGKKNTTVLSWGDSTEISIAVLKSQIVVISGFSNFIKTGIYVSSEKPANICFSVDNQKRLLTLFSENKLIGRYLLPEKNYVLYDFSLKFHNYTAYDIPFSGKIHMIEIWNSPRKFQLKSK